jgi:hypothetical protein
VIPRADPGTRYSPVTPPIAKTNGSTKPIMPAKKELSKHDREQYSYDPKQFYTSNEPDWAYYCEAKAKNTLMKFTLKFGDVLIGRIAVWGRYSIIIETEDHGRVLVHKDGIATAMEAKEPRS